MNINDYRDLIVVVLVDDIRGARSSKNRAKAVMAAGCTATSLFRLVLCNPVIFNSVFPQTQPKQARGTSNSADKWGACKVCLHDY